MTGTRVSPFPFEARTVGAQRIWVGDAFLDPALVKIIEHRINVLPLYRADYDTPDSKAVLHLKHEFVLDDIDEDVVLRALRDRIVAAVGEVYGVHRPRLDRVHVNDSVFGEIVTPHCDIPVGVTALYFVNSEWRDEWDGETLFYAHGEAVSAVAMRPGRVVIFPGNMLHRAGVASRRCTVARRTLAYKFHTETIVP